MFENLLEYLQVIRNGETPLVHPDSGWLGKLRGLIRCKDAGTSETTPPAQAESCNIETRLALFPESNSKRLAEVESLLHSNKVHMVMNEVKDRELVMDRRERDHEVWGGMFNNEYLRQGTLDLFDVQACFDDAW